MRQFPLLRVTTPATLRQVLSLLLTPVALSAQSRPLIAYGTITDHFGTPVPGTKIEVVSVDVSPGVPAAERAPVGVGQCAGARPARGTAVAGSDGRFRVALDLGRAIPALACLAVVTTPPAGRPLSQLHLAMDSVLAGAVAAAGDSVRMDIVLPDASVGLSSTVPLPTPPNFRSADEELVWLARAVPGGFGGYWRTAAAEPMKVYLVDMAQAPQAKRLLQEYFRERPPVGGAPPDIVFMRGRWEAATLVDWRDRLRRAGAAAGVRDAVLRLDWNRVQVSVRGPSGRSLLRRRLPVLAIPESALLIVGG